MQSTTQISSNQLQNCMVECGRWPYAQGVGSPAREAYQRFYETYLATESGMGTTAQSAGRTAQQRPARQRSRSAGQTRTRTAGEMRTRSAGQTRTRSPRTRTAAGTPGPKVAGVLAKIVANPEINIDGLRKTFARSMEPNIIGTAL